MGVLDHVRCAVGVAMVDGSRESGNKSDAKDIGNRQVSKARLTVPALRLTKLGWNSDYISSLV